MKKKEYLKKSLTDMKRDLAKKQAAQKPAKFKYKLKKGKLKTGSKLSTMISNKAHQIKVQSKNPRLYDSSGNAYANRMKNTK